MLGNRLEPPSPRSCNGSQALVPQLLCSCLCPPSPLACPAAYGRATGHGAGGAGALYVPESLRSRREHYPQRTPCSGLLLTTRHPRGGGRGPGSHTTPPPLDPPTHIPATPPP